MSLTIQKAKPEIVLAVFLVAAGLILFGGIAFAQNTTSTSGSFVDTVWGTLAGIMSLFMAVSGFAIFWAQKVRSRLAQSNDEYAKKLVKILDTTVSALETGQQFVEATRKQEVKAKQFGEILYDVMGPKADEIKGKYEVQLKNLTADIQSAEKGSTEYNEKLKALYGILEEIGGAVKTPQ